MGFDPIECHVNCIVGDVKCHEHVVFARRTKSTARCDSYMRFGVQPIAGEICISPCLPKSWGRAKVTLNGAVGTVEIAIENPGRIGAGRSKLTVDGARWPFNTVAFPGKDQVRRVAVQILPPAALPLETEVSETS